jgi:methionine synthase II (cobalamin-independent)
LVCDDNHQTHVTDIPWPQGAATGIGSMPGQDPAEAARIVVGELPDLPHLPELPGRGLGADLIGRTAALLVDLAIEEVPSGYRVTGRPGREHRRAVGLLRADLDALDEAIDAAGVAPSMIKVQAAGPWTLTAGIELSSGHRVLTDPGALREFTSSLAEGLAAHAAEVGARTGAGVVVQLDEPSLPAVLAGRLPTASGLGTVAAVEAAAAETALRRVIEAVPGPRIVHCCAPNPPVRLLRAAGADAVALDVSLVDGTVSEQVGEFWDGGGTLLLGLVPATDPGRPVTLRQLAEPALRLVDRLGYPRELLATGAVPTPSCGLAGASREWVRRALGLSRDLGKAFVEPPEGW